jgi:uncharacterized protein with NAD-binding domain and iron-sulfur cluster
MFVGEHVAGIVLVRLPLLTQTGSGVVAEAKRTKVAVLGGGPAALAAAYELSAPEHEDRFELTVYQPGWRLGGKCASGRNLARGGRVEEHGLHVWFGFYDNAFSLARAVYEELERPASHPLATFEEAFESCDRLVLYDRQGDGWRDFRITFPRNDLAPGYAHELPDFWEIATRMCTWAVKRWDALNPARASRVRTPASGDQLASRRILDLASDLTGSLRIGSQREGEDLLRRALRVARTRHLLDAAAKRHAAWPARRLRRREATHTGKRVRVLAKLLSGARDWLWEHVARDRCADDPRLRLFFTTFDTFASAIAGIAADRVLERGWEAIDDRDLCEWLAANGAKPVTLGATPAQRAPLLRAVYDVAFAYPGGDVAAADAAAGTAMSNLLRLLFTYRGSVLYKMAAGMGDTVVAPLYELLRGRGVRFEYFSAVSSLHLTRDGDLVDAIEIVPQVELANDTYDPLVAVEGLDCWPSEPKWAQVRDGEHLKQSGVDFEVEPNPLGREPLTLKRGQHFDQVVLGIPVGVLPGICSEISVRHERFARMLRSARTVSTQAFQLWLTKPTVELGWTHGQRAVARTHVEPLDTWCDMSYLLAREGWNPDEGVRAIAYFCGVLDDHGEEERAQANARAKHNACAFLEEHVGALWPRAVLGNGGEATCPGGALDWTILADHRGRRGSARLEAQYWRANTTASERYVLTPAKSMADRLAADESGVDNLWLAGDWTRNGINGGCVEAAVTSGMQAARALSGHRRALSGENTRWIAGDRCGRGEP